MIISLSTHAGRVPISGVIDALNGLPEDMRRAAVARLKETVPKVRFVVNRFGLVDVVA